MYGSATAGREDWVRGAFVRPCVPQATSTACWAALAPLYVHCTSAFTLPGGKVHGPDSRVD